MTDDLRDLSPGAFTMSRRSLLSGMSAAGGLLLSGPAMAQRTASAAPLAFDAAATSLPISVSAKRIGSFSRLSGTKTFGRLTFRGGLVLTSQSTHFGGLSGLTIEPDGRGFLTVSDEGYWLTGTLGYDGEAPSGIEAAQIGPIVAMTGKSLWRKRDRDAEAVALVEGNLTRGTVLMSFERNHRIGRFPVVNRVVGVPSGYLKMPVDAKRMGTNRGLEAMTVIAGGPHKGAVIAISERFPDAGGNHVGWLWVKGEPQRFTLEDKNGFEITDVASLGDGSLLILERRFRWTEGVKLQIRLVPVAEVVPGGLFKGELLLEAGMSSEIDNMEALAVHRTPNGDTVLTLMSDDNFNALFQRTILLQFKLT